MITLQIIMAHSEAQSTFSRHLGLWASNPAKIMVFCPIDSIVRTTEPVIAYGAASHHDATANRRFKWLIRFLKNYTNYEGYLIHEYDSFCVSPEYPALEPGRLWANAWPNNDRPRFSETHFFHPPLAMDREILVAISEALDKLPDSAQHGFWDRLLGLAVDQAGIPWKSYDHLGFSRNTIESTDIPAAVEAKRDGAVFFHGVKTPHAMQAILNA